MTLLTATCRDCFEAGRNTTCNHYHPNTARGSFDAQRCVEAFDNGQCRVCAKEKQRVEWLRATGQSNDGALSLATTEGGEVSIAQTGKLTLVKKED